MPEASVVVVGAGASGLSAAAALKRKGIEAIVLEQHARVGGTWERRYDRLHLHTVRGFSGLAYYGIPRRYPKYLSRDDFVSYLNEYAEHFRLRVIAGCVVHKVAKEAAAPYSWNISTSGDAWRARAVVIATGQYRIPIAPSWPGVEIYGGQLLHSASYTKPLPFAGKRVLVVGAGNSGTEIATDVAENGAAFVSLSIRTSPAIVPRDPFGMPVQRTGILLNFLPSRIADRLGRLTSRIVLGDLTQYGVRRAEWGPFSSRRVPVIDVGFVKALKQELVHIRPALARLTATGAVFTDGSAEPFDAIIAATGFSTGLNELLDSTEPLSESGEPIDPAGNPTALPGLFFIGYTHSLRGHLFEASLASRRLAKNVVRYLGQR
ncbi:MAG: NAD(P)/FAD-dependent oxidoreductase [Gemmatimonadota bacterium]|nr:NAD(P)/FAD-dependent oxidoreductase [Gemmatimonadota bacterium]